MHNSLTHFPLEFVEVTQFAHGGAFSCGASLAKLRGLVVEEEGLVDLTKMSTYIAFHFISLDASTVLGQNGIAKGVAAIGIAQFVLNLG